MNKYCVVVADGARARLMSLEPSHDSSGETKRRLFELKTMLNPEHRVHGHELFEGSRGSATARNGGHVFTLDDHHNGHEHEYDRRFASRIAEETLQFARDVGGSKLIIAADAHTLGLLRDETRLYKKSGLTVLEVRHDLSKLSAEDIQAYIEQAGLIPD